MSKTKRSLCWGPKKPDAKVFIGLIPVIPRPRTGKSEEPGQELLPGVCVGGVAGARGSGNVLGERKVLPSCQRFVSLKPVHFVVYKLDEKMERSHQRNKLFSRP